MRTIKFFIVAILAMVMGVTVYAQNQTKKASTKTETFKVYGNCDQCKARIEKAAKVDGVSKAEWNDETKLLTLVYDPSKVSSDDVQKKIAAVGHDTEKYNASDKDYKALPSCCRYERNK